jgi:carboxyl-terminal processing protease
VTLDGPGERLRIDLPGLPEPPPLPGGFGFRLQPDPAGRLQIAALIDEGPAAAAGLAVGDRVLGIDDADAGLWTPAQAWQALSGRDSARLRLQRGEGAVQTVALRRASFFPLLR